MTLELPRWRPGEPLERLQDCLDRGGILVIPTESSYGLAADPTLAKGVASIFEVKRREGRKPLPIVVGSAAQLASLGVDPGDPAVRLIAPLWPAALSVVLPCDRPVPAAAGESTVAVRVPDHALLLGLLRRLDRPLTATSANLAGEPPILDLAEASSLLAGADAIAIEGGVLPGGPPSTLVRLEPGGFRVLRPGRFPVERLPVPPVNPEALPG